MYMSYQNEQRILRIKRAEQILRDILPCEREKALSKICYEMGLTKKVAKEYMKLLFDNGIILYDKEGKLSCKK